MKDEGLINHALMALGLIAEPLAIFATNEAVVIGIVYSYLPFVILPIYNALEKQDAVAARGGGRSRRVADAHVPRRSRCRCRLTGVLAGALLMFIPAVGEFVIPDLLGGSDTMMIGRVMWNDFFENRDWPAAAAGAIVLLVLLVGPIVWFERRQARAEATS